MSEEPISQEISHPETHKEKKQKTPDILTLMQEEILQLNEPEDKLSVALKYLESALSHSKTPDFKTFWEVRKFILNIFKGHLSPSVRQTSWEKFDLLSKEGKKLKDLLEEESDFAKEQIDIAITSIEDEIAKHSEKKEEVTFFIGKECQTLFPKKAFYEKRQTVLNFLNLFASKITSLRKELMHTEMRIRSKNSFFDRLSKAGDFVFPKRKELIQEISEEFSKDVNYFVQSHFGDKTSNLPPYVLKEEIKSLQNLAKVLTLNTQSFAATRLQLSEAWDSLKEIEKERKVEIEKKKEEYKKNEETLRTSITNFKEKFSNGELDAHHLSDELKAFSQTMRNTPLGREEVARLKELVKELELEAQKKIKEKEEHQRLVEKEKQEKKLQLLNEVKGEINALIKESKDLKLEELTFKKEAILEKIQSAPVLKFHKKELEQLLKTITEIMHQKKDEALLDLPEDKQIALSQLREFLEEKRKEKSAIKERIASLKKLSQASGISFERAIEYQEKLNEEKGMLEKIDHAISEVERKIVDLKL